MGQQWVADAEASSTGYAAPGHHFQIERLVWVLAVATFGIGDTLTTTLGQSLGLVESNPIYAALFGFFPVPLVMAVGMGLQLYLAWEIARRIRSPVRLLIPAALALLGARVVYGNVLVIASVLG